jgi:hypothetical protein
MLWIVLNGFREQYKDAGDQVLPSDVLPEIIELVDECLADYVLEKEDLDSLQQEIQNNYSADNLRASDIDKIDTYIVNLSAEVYYEKYLVGQDLDYLVRKFHEEEMKIRLGRIINYLDTRLLEDDI